jgi:hypothetical protein
MLLATLAMAVPAIAQTRDDLSSTQPRRGAMRSRREPMGLRLFGYVDIESELAKKSFKAVTGSSILIGYGAGLELTHLAGPLFLRFAYGQASRSGERVIVFDNDVFSTGIPITVKKTPLEIGVGFSGDRVEHSVAPFFGGGLLLLKYQETTTEFADPTDNTSQTFTGFNVFAGLDLSMSRHFSIGVEGQYRTVQNAIGETGVSATYGEKDLGGFGARVSFGFKK